MHPTLGLYFLASPLVLGGGLNAEGAVGVGDDFAA
jgi:hypothetical protein